MNTYFTVISSMFDKLLDFALNCDLFVIAFLALCMSFFVRLLSVSFYFK